MKRSNIERNIVIALFALVLVTFSLAQRDSRHMQHYSTLVAEKAKQLLARF